MLIDFIIKIKDDKNPPEFMDGGGKGVIAVITVDFSTEEYNPEDPIFQSSVMQRANELLNEYFEVIPKLKKE